MNLGSDLISRTSTLSEMSLRWTKQSRQTISAFRYLRPHLGQYLDGASLKTGAHNSNAESSDSSNSSMSSEKSMDSILLHETSL